MKIQGIRGIKDILPDEIAKWQWVEKIAHNISIKLDTQRTQSIPTVLIEN